MRLFIKIFMCLVLCALITGGLYANVQTVAVQDDTIKAPDVAAPVVDAIGNDACWQDVPWQSIDQVWIQYGVPVDPDDYSGRFKVVWSSQTNLLYFLVEVIDDVSVGGFRRGQTADNYHYDLLEVFIDEDCSGGLHVFDGTPQGGLGTNAENAFSYHIYADFPEEGEVNNLCDVGDTDGTRWGNNWSPQYADHFPEFAIRKAGTLVTREFSLIVYNDTFEVDNKENSRVILTAGKVMGLSLAVCDNDGIDEEPKTRDNFFGSVWVEAAHYNDHWMNADDYGRIKLVAGSASGVGDESLANPSSFRVQALPNAGEILLNMTNDYFGRVPVNIYNILGQQVYQSSLFKSQQTLYEGISMPNLSRGVYFITAAIADQHYSHKLMWMF